MTAITAQDILKYITMIRVNFPPDAYSFVNAKDLDKYLTTGEETDTSILIKSWLAILKGYPRELCNNAVINAIKNFEYGKYPKINDILKEIERMREAYEKSDAELWAELSTAIREVGRWYSRFNETFTISADSNVTQGDYAREQVAKIFNELSPELKEYCRSQRGLIDLSEIPTKDFQFEKARFLRVMPTIKERARVRQQTGESLAGLIQGLSGAIACDDKKQLTGG